MKEYKSEVENEFEFDLWMELAKTDPEAFEKKRQDLMNSAINEAPERMHQRLKGLQWSIDAKIKTSKNPMDGCIKIYQMMMDSVYESGGLLDSISKLSNEDEDNTQRNIEKKVVPNVFEFKQQNQQ